MDKQRNLARYLGISDIFVSKGLHSEAKKAAE
jgi:hypothetical protein